MTTLVQAHHSVHGETTRDRQDRFLEAQATAITDTEACKVAGISRNTFYRWIKEDTEGFNERLAEVAPQRGRNLETLMFDVLAWANTPERFDKLLRYPTLLLRALAGNIPEKYGFKVGLGQAEARQIVEELMRMRDDPSVKVADGVGLEEELDEILGGKR